jgi:hypothetical protein
MIVKYSRTLPLEQAILLTFDSKSLCEICEAVGEAKKKQSETLASGGKFPGKVLCVFPNGAERLKQLPAAAFARQIPEQNNPCGEDRRTPPVPPPRNVV